MGIPQSNTDQTGIKAPYTYGGQEHISQPVVIGELPVVDGEDSKAWNVGKYEREELVRNLFTDGVFIGDVWGDASSKDSFKVSWLANVLTVEAGRATVGNKRVDLGLTGTYDQDFTSALALPAGGDEHIIYLDIFERSIPQSPVIFPPAGLGMNLSVYADFSSFNLSDSTIKYATGTIPASLPAPAAGHTFFELGRINSAGVVTDTRTIAALKIFSKSSLADVVVDPDGTVGVDCTHTDLNLALLYVINNLGPVQPSDRVIRVYLTPDSYTLPNTQYNLPVNVVIYSDFSIGGTNVGAKIDMTSGARFDLAGGLFQINNVAMEIATNAAILFETNPNGILRLVDCKITKTGTHNTDAISQTASFTLDAIRCDIEGRVVCSVGSTFSHCTFDYDSAVAGTFAFQGSFDNCTITMTTSGAIPSSSTFLNCTFVFTAIDVVVFMSTKFYSCVFSGQDLSHSGAGKVQYHSCEFIGSGATNTFNLDPGFASGTIEIKGMDATNIDFIFDAAGTFYIDGLVGINVTTILTSGTSSQLVNFSNISLSGTSATFRLLNGGSSEIFVNQVSLNGTLASFEYNPAVVGLTAQSVSISSIFTKVNQSHITLIFPTDLGIDPASLVPVRPYSFNNLVSQHPNTVFICDASGAVPAVAEKIISLTGCNIGNMAVSNSHGDKTRIQVSGCNARFSQSATSAVGSPGRIDFSGCNFGSPEIGGGPGFGANGTAGVINVRVRFSGCTFSVNTFSVIDVAGAAAAGAQHRIELVGCRIQNYSSQYAFASGAGINWDVVSCFITGAEGVALLGLVFGGGAVNAKTAIGPASANNVQY